MSTPIERALAELRSVPMRETTPELEPEPSACPFACTGDERGYQWHQRTGNLPACEKALEASRILHREYLREWRKRNPGYSRQWRAKQKTKDGRS